MGPTKITGTLVMGLTAGLLGGFLAQHLGKSTQVHAQERQSQQYKGDRFALVDGHGKVRGEFKMNGERPEIIFYDKNGNPTWEIDGDKKFGVQPLVAK